MTTRAKLRMPLGKYFAGSPGSQFLVRPGFVVRVADHEHRAVGCRVEDRHLDFRTAAEEQAPITATSRRFATWLLALRMHSVSSQCPWAPGALSYLINSTRYGPALCPTCSR